jgi:IS5 family transposase
VRFADSGLDTFYGDFFYDGLIPKDNFYRLLAAVIPWEVFAEKLLVFYKGGAQYGRPPYHPILMLKVLVLGRLNNRSLRELQRDITYNLEYKYFIGLAANLPCPDFTTLSDFQQRLTSDRKRDVLGEMIDEIIDIARKRGIRVGGIQAVDSTAVIANVNTAKNKAHVEAGEPVRDPDAEWAAKRKYYARDETGKRVKLTQYFFGYKMHASLNAASGLITSVICSKAKRHDGHVLEALVNHDLALGLPVRIVTADRAYDDGENHLYLEQKKIKSAIRLNKNRLEKKDDNKEPWVKLVATREYKEGLGVRGRVEAKFGEGKTQHGLGRCQGIGLEAFARQAKLTVLAMNLKRLVQLFYGTRFYQGVSAPIAP